MAKNIASENVSLGITVNSILPGLIGTEKVRALPDRGARALRRRQRPARHRAARGAGGGRRRSWPTSRRAEAGYVTGQEIVVAGGGDLLQVSLGSSRR